MAETPIQLKVISGLGPPGPVRLFGGPMDGAVLPHVYRTPWLAVLWPGSEEQEWYLGVERDAYGTPVYSHLSVKDYNVIWPMVLGWNGGDDDEGEEPFVTV